MSAPEVIDGRKRFDRAALLRTCSVEQMRCEIETLCGDSLDDGERQVIRSLDVHEARWVLERLYHAIDVIVRRREDRAEPSA